MIKAAGQLNGKPLLVIGLSGENIARLMSDEPIIFDTGPFGLPALSVLIVGGKTEDDIARDLSAVLGRTQGSRPEIQPVNSPTPKLGGS